MEIIAGFINTHSLWFWLVLFTILWVGNKIYNHFRAKKAARNIVDIMKNTYGKEHEHRIIYNLAEFSFLDIRFYAQTEQRLGELGFRKLGDVENVTLSQTYPRLRTFVRAFVLSEERIQVGIYHMKPLGKWRISKFLGGMVEKKNVEFETEFSDGTFLCTSNSLDGQTFDNGPKFQVEFRPGMQDVKELLAVHRERMAAYRAAHPDVRPIVIQTLQDGLDSGNRAIQVRAVYRRQLKGVVQEHELERIEGHKLNKYQQKLYQEIEKIQGTDTPVVANEAPLNAAEATAEEYEEVYELEPLEEESPRREEVPAGVYDPVEENYSEVAAALKKKQHKKKSWVENGTILVISLVLFFQLGLIRWGWDRVVMILGVLFVHEMGHYVGMRMFGYRNVQMFFIPLLGAAVSGENREAAGWKKALVILMGPMPGIFMSIGFWIAYIITETLIWRDLGLMFLFINAFNLLPFMPLDGGRFLHEILFSRNRYLEAFTILIAGLGFLLGGIAAGDWILGGLGVLNLFLLVGRFQISGMAKAFRHEKKQQDEEWFESVVADPTYADEIPEPYLKDILRRIYDKYRHKVKPDAAANLVLQVWERVRVRPPGIGGTIGLMLLFFLAIVVSAFSGFLAIGSIYWQEGTYQQEIRVVEYQDEQGRTCYKEQVYFLDELKVETELSEDGKYYHGRAVYYYSEGEIYMVGKWHMGRRDGEWKYYAEGELYYVILYYQGNFVLKRELEEGKWMERYWEDLSPEKQEYYQQLEACKPQGPDYENAKRVKESPPIPTS